MNAEERKTWVGLVSSLIINAWFYHLIWGMFHDGTSTAPDALQIWARGVIWVIPIGIGVNLGLTLLAALLQALVTGDRRVTFLKDERDAKFEFWGLGASMFLAVMGFLAAMGALAMGYSGFIAFNLIYLGFSLGDIAGNLLKLALYRVC